MIPLLPLLLRMLFPGRHSRFVFERQQVPLPPRPDSLNLYIHLPFCRRICPFCPYVKTVYDKDTSDSYQRALLRELGLYREAWGNVKLGSVYFGGGTPSLTPGLIDATMSWLARSFSLGGEVGAEVHPLDARPDKLASLRSSGVTMVSLGIQTFNDRLLAVLGRGYDGRAAREACRNVLAAGFDSTDIDLIFAIPGQSVDEAEADVAAACETGAGQVSTYPLISFSHTPLDAHLKAASLSLPSWWTERRMLDAVVARAREAGYSRTSIWSFGRPDTPRYTTVTRDEFIGVGAGASSRMGDWFWLNTFGVPEYIATAGSGAPPALATRLDEGDRMAYWLFWRCYDTVIDTERFRALFGRGFPRTIRAAIALLRLLALVHRDGSVIRLTDSGAFLFHLVEQEYTHSYLERLWAACTADPWPGAVRL